MTSSNESIPDCKAHPARWLLRGVIAIAILVGVACLGYFLVQRFVFLNLHRIEGTQVYRSAQPDEDFLRKLFQDKGLRSIIKLNSRNSGSRSRDEEAAARKLGLNMVYLPMAMHRLPTRQELIDLLNAIESTPRPVLIHCNAGADRTGLAAVLVAMQQGESFEQAVDRQLSMKYLHVGIWGEDVDEVLEQYRDDCNASGVATGGWAEFKRYVLERYRPSFYDAKLSIRRLELPGDPKIVQAVVTITNLSRRPFPMDGGHPIEVVAYIDKGESPKAILDSEPLDRALGPGQSVDVPLSWTASRIEPGQTIDVDLLHREVAWFGEKGSQVLRITPSAQSATTMPLPE